MLLDIFFATESDKLQAKRTQWLGYLEIHESLLEGLTVNEKDELIKAVIVSSITNNIEWAPVPNEYEQHELEVFKIDENQLH